MKGGEPPAHIRGLEAEVMEEVWREDGEITVRDVLETLNKRSRRKRAYTTLMTIMGRLHEKGLLRRKLRGKTHHYFPAVTRDQYVQARARSQVDELVADYGDVALAHFARQVDSLGAERAKRLRELAEEGS